jgi:excisionase family DNA binding protein
VRVREVLASHRDTADPVRFTDDDGGEVTVPRPAVDLLVRILANMAAGQGVTVVPAHTELTTQQAASMLNVSRPFLIGLLEQGEIEYRTVGTHRRIKASSLLDYMRRDDAKRRDAADELAALTQEMGLD